MIEQFTRPRRKRPLAKAGLLLVLSACAAGTTNSNQEPEHMITSTLDTRRELIVEAKRYPLMSIVETPTTLAYINSDDGSDVSDIYKKLLTATTPSDLNVVVSHVDSGGEVCQATMWVQEETPTSLRISPGVAGLPSDLDRMDRTVHMDTDIGEVTSNGGNEVVTKDMSKVALVHAAREIAEMSVMACLQLERDILR